MGNTETDLNLALKSGIHKLASFHQRFFGIDYWEWVWETEEAKDRQAVTVLAGDESKDTFFSEWGAHVDKGFPTYSKV